nr:oligosaccharide flippase family protein [Nocardioides albus]
MARLLGPEEFGTYAVAFVALMAILSFNELGVSLAIVRWQEDPAEIAPTVTTISLGMSAVLTVAAMVAAPWFTSAMGAPEATGLVRLLSLCVLINGLVATPAALMQRMFRQGQRMVVDQVNVWVGAVVSVVLAALGMGALSLAVGRLAGAAVSAVLFLRYSPLPYRLGLDRRYVNGLLAFGLPLAGASVVVFLVGFLDQLIVGRLLGAVMLGYYVLATNLASWPITLFSQPMRSVAPALFARLQHDALRTREAFGRVLRLLAGIALPACAAIAATAPDLVRFVYGAEWAPAGEVLHWLAMFAALRILFELAYDYVVVLGRSNAILAVQIVGIFALAPALWVAVGWRGIDGAALAVVAVAVLVTGPMYVRLLRLSGIRLGSLVRALVVPLLGAVVCYALGLVVAAGVESPFLTLAAAGTATLAVIAVLLWWHRGDLQTFRSPG